MIPIFLFLEMCKQYFSLCRQEIMYPKKIMSISN